MNRSTLLAALTLVLAVGPSAADAADHKKLGDVGRTLVRISDCYNQFIPTARVGDRDKVVLSWRVHACFYVGGPASAVAKQFKLDEPWDSPHNKKVFDDNPMPDVFALGGYGDAAGKLTRVQAFAGQGALGGGPPWINPSNVTDGTTHTLLLGVSAKPVPWTKPEDMPFDPKQDPHKLLRKTDAGYTVAFDGGGQTTLKADTPEAVMKAFIAPAGRETVNPADYK